MYDGFTFLKISMLLRCENASNEKQLFLKNNCFFVVGDYRVFPIAISWCVILKAKNDTFIRASGTMQFFYMGSSDIGVNFCFFCFFFESGKCLKHVLCAS